MNGSIFGILIREISGFVPARIRSGKDFRNCCKTRAALNKMSCMFGEISRGCCTLNLSQMVMLWTLTSMLKKLQRVYDELKVPLHDIGQSKTRTFIAEQCPSAQCQYGQSQTWEPGDVYSTLLEPRPYTVRFLTFLNHGSFSSLTNV